METDSGKLLVQLINRFNKTELFFVGWLVLVAVFVFLMTSFRRSQLRRNFRETPYKPKGTGVVRQGSTVPQTTSKKDDELPARKSPG